MVKTIEYKNPTRLQMVDKLRKTAKTQESNIWKRVADELDRVRKKRSTVNLHRINKHTDKGDTVVVPGKVLGGGLLNHELKIAAFKFSQGAKDKIEAAGGKAVELEQLLKENPTGSNIKLIG